MPRRIMTPFRVNKMIKFKIIFGVFFDIFLIVNSN